MTDETTSIVACIGCGRKNRVPAAAAGTPRCGQCHAALPWVVDTDDHGFRVVADDARLPVLVDLWAPWCGPCRAVSPALERLAGDFAGRVKLVKVNVDEAPGLSRRFSLQAVPTLLIMHHGEVAAHRTGAAPEAALRSWLDQSLASIESHPRTGTG